MPLPIPDLDDRRFDDLVVELGERLQRQLPELTRLAPGDPAHALVDLFAWLTETVLYRANRIPERQRLAFLNLLQLPRRPARPARGVVCIDALPTDRRSLPPLLAAESALLGGPGASFTTVGELQPTPLQLRVLVKTRLSNTQLHDEGISLQQLREQYGVEPAAFRPTSLVPGRDRLDTRPSLDAALHLALVLPRPLAAHADALRQLLAGVVLNIAVAPDSEADGDLAASQAPRRLAWELAWWPAPDTRPDEVQYLPLEQVADSSHGARVTGTVRLRLPRDVSFLRASTALDPQYAGMGDTPPEPPADLAPGQLLCWLRVTSRDGDDLQLGYLGVNGVDVIGQGVARDLMLGAGTGRPDQLLALPHADVDDTSLQLDVEEAGRFVPWQAVAHFHASGPDDRVYLVDAEAATVRFGDGVRGKRPPVGARIRAASYRHGGGSAGNLPAGGIKALAQGASRLQLRHEWATRGGVDAESVDAAERRIPAFLTHRDRAVTADDFAVLARDNPLRPIARADAVAGFFPGASLKAVRRQLPGVISVFILPEQAPALAAAPRPSAGALRDVYDYLGARTLLGTELYVLAPQFQPVSLALAVEVVDPANEQTVFKAVELALLHYLWALPPHGPRGAGWPLGRAIDLNELRTQAGRVDGVLAVNAVRLFFLDLDAAPGTTNAWRELADQAALPQAALPLADYQLPELMAVAVQGGEGPPAPPPGYAPGSATPAGSGARAVPVPVIPDRC
ncbi:MAG: hypothetical protein RLZZ584_3690 [Pseudomonadota bacterium]